MFDLFKRRPHRSAVKPPPLPSANRYPHPNYQPTGNPWLLFLVAGGALAAGLLVYVRETRVFGQSCYHIGEITMQTQCMPHETYMGAWVIAAGLIGLGLVLALRDRR